MIMLIAKNTLIEGKQKEFTELAEKLVLATRKEAGCIAYDLVADLEEHRATTHFQSIVPQFGPLRTKPSEVSVCNVLPFAE